MTLSVQRVEVIVASRLYQHSFNINQLTSVNCSVQTRSILGCRIYTQYHNKCGVVVNSLLRGSQCGINGLESGNKGSFGSRQSDSLRSLHIKIDQRPSHTLVTRIHTRLISDSNPIEDAC
jgi:hypothetical protein